MWGWYLADPIRLALPIAWPGQLSLFDIDTRRTTPPIILCSRCDANLPVRGSHLCGTCQWYIQGYSDRFAAEPSRERRMYVEYLTQQHIATFEGK